MLELNFLQDIEIDLDNLDLEWQRHPYLYARYCEASAQASRRQKEAYHRQKVVYSQLILRADKELVALGQKATETTKDAWALTQPEYEEATKDRQDAEYEAEHLQNAVYAFGHRKDALQELVRLHSTGYFAGPREPRDLNPEFRRTWVEQKEVNKEAAHQEVATGIRDRLNRVSSSEDPVELVKSNVRSQRG